jgi:hypothetical protein
MQFVVDGNDEVNDVVRLLDVVEQRYVTLEQLPFQEIVQAAKAHYQYRR